ncbi:hypothetical protein SAMN04489740_0863 [Arthrobacter alpinus]|uniref:Uncharacterized protein n=1 Tax=Arthrobacter alpinus TaxID=656366 RepID=A0A1H5GWI2_9MICC|nr:hypothetical protein [Arthrobacter alpinus]SEE19831.1 hypothetical protein SAMN04489740_0863 [Arthrobacter alpinus]
MDFYRVPGSRNYKGTNDGLKEIATSSTMGAASLAVAKQLAGNAGAVGRGTYEAANTTVTAGWRNERRAGAVARELVPDGRDARDAILVRVTESMRVRNP